MEGISVDLFFLPRLCFALIAEVLLEF